MPNKGMFWFSNNSTGVQFEQFDLRALQQLDQQMLELLFGRVTRHRSINFDVAPWALI